MTNTEKRIEFFRLVSIFVQRADIGGIRLMPFAFFRTPQEQKVEFDEGNSLCDGTKKRSRHQSWLAMDFVIVEDGGKLVWNHNARYEILGEIWESLGGRWGGRFKPKPDCFHFEYRGEIK